MLRIRHGFTLIEIMIAAGILAALLLVFFGIFRSSTGQFQAGSWRHLAQKRAQVFLTQLRTLIEQANHPFVMEPGNQRIDADQPIYLHSSFNGNDLVTLSGQPAGGIMFFSVSTVAEKAPPAGAGMASLLQIADQQGSWAGVALSHQPADGSQQLLLIHSGQTADLGTNLAMPYDCPGTGNFQRLADGGTRMLLEDVEAIKITRPSDNATGPIEIHVELAKVIQGRKVSFTETILTRPVHDAPLLTTESF